MDQKRKCPSGWSLRVAAVIAAAIVLVAAWSCSKGTPSGEVEQITIASVSELEDALIDIAVVKGFFATNGLDVRLHPYPSGLAATDAMLKGDADMATAAEFVIAGKALKREKFLSLGTVAGFQNEFIIGRHDKGVGQISDLRRKKIGLPLHTSPEFSFSRFLELHGLSTGQVTLINVPPKDLTDAIVSAKVDAIVVWEPYATAARDQLGSRSVSWPSQNGQLKYWNVLTTGTWIEKHGKAIGPFLKSLAEADSYVARHPDETRALMEKRLGYGHTYMAHLWPQYQFGLSLGQPLMTAMKDEARWMINNKITDEKDIPDFANYVNVDGLKKVKPEAVSIIR
jgi:NitT/TauT family transport system substrate-binding protein